MPPNAFLTIASLYNTQECHLAMVFTVALCQTRRPLAWPMTAPGSGGLDLMAAGC